MDLAALSALPDSVKRLILAHAANSTSSPASSSPSAVDGSLGGVVGVGSHATSPQVVGVQQQPRAPPRAPGTWRKTLPQLPSLKSGLAVVDGFVPLEQVKAARQCAEAALQEQHRKAGMGGSLLGWKDDQVRGDLARWLHVVEEHSAGRTALAEIVEVLQELQGQLTRDGYDVRGRATFQLALYPGQSTRYVRHADRSASAPTRRITAICYLNSDWKPQDGGQLAVYNHSVTTHDTVAHVGWEAGEPATIVAPLAGRLVVFDSAIDHEVLSAHAYRWAVTAWYHCAQPLTTTISSPKTTTTISSPITTTTTSPPSTDVISTIVNHDQDNPQQQQQQQQQQQHIATTLQPHASTTPLPSSGSPSLPHIFVSIAAYRDPECQWTVKDLIQKATHPERVRVGICWQVDPIQDAAFVRVAGTGPTGRGFTGRDACSSTMTNGNDGHPGALLAAPPPPPPPPPHHHHQDGVKIISTQGRQHWLHQVREVRIPANEATGPSKARALAATLWDGEEYMMQIDSHMRFVDGWDVLCIDQLSRAESLLPPGSCQGAVLTTYPPNYEGSGAAAVLPSRIQPVLLCPSGFDGDGMLRTKGRMLAEGWEDVVRLAGARRGEDVGRETEAAGQEPRLNQESQRADGEALTSLTGRVLESSDVDPEMMHCLLLSRRSLGDPIPCVGWAAGFSFSRAKALVCDAAYPPPRALPHLFFGEEMYQYARLWTHGYECFSPAVNICYHQWQRSARTHKLTINSPTTTTNLPPQHSSSEASQVDVCIASSSTVADMGAHSEQQQQQQQQRQHSRQKVLAVLRAKPWPVGVVSKHTAYCVQYVRAAVDGAACVDREGVVVQGSLPKGWGVGEPWGLGNMRSLAEWQRRGGIDVVEGTVVDEARWNWLPKDVFDQ